MKIDQAVIIDFLSDRFNYPGPPESVRKIQTHGALVFLAGDDVYKIKRKVRYPYLDFSSLQKREQACRRELEINQSVAPEIYLGLTPITASPDGLLSIDGDGTVVEWAVHMRRFDDRLLLQNLAQAGQLSTSVANSVARRVALFHQNAPRLSGAGAATRLDNLVAGLVTHFSASDQYPANDKSRFCQQLAEQSALIRDQVEQRGHDGHIVRGHGDLHLANIVLLHGEPVLFDALEYSEELATVDVLYDLAFLIMDLEVNGLPEQANRALASYLNANESIDNFDALGCLPVYLALRAGIRSMVETQRQKQFYEAPYPGGLSMSVEYLDYANRALDLAGQGQLLAVGGLSGTGKSTVSKIVAPRVGARPGAIHLRSDIERKSMFAVSETTRLPDTGYTSEASQRVYARMMDKAERALRAGQSVILDAVFMSVKDRDLAGQVAARCGVRFTGVWLTATMNRLHQRVTNRVVDASDATVDVVNHQLETDVGKIDWNCVNANGSADEVARQVHTLLEKDTI